MNLLAESVRHWTTHLWSTNLQITIFISLVLAVSFCFRRFPARYRYVLWLLVLVRLAIPTSITSPLGIGQYPERFLAEGVARVSKQQLQTPPQLPIEQTAFIDTQSWITEEAGPSFGSPATLSPTGGSSNSVPPLCIIWLSGVLVLVLAIITRILLFRRRVRMLRPVVHPGLVAAIHRLRRQLGIKRTVKLLEAADSDSIRFPSVHGVIRPTIIMPAGMAVDWTPDTLEPLLLHELTHIKRRDCLVNLAQIVLQVLYFYHPMVWFANWIIRRERELACDDDVVRYSSGCPTAYVRSMLTIAERAVNQRRRQLLGIAMADNFSNLGRRIRRMMNKDYSVSKQSGLVYLVFLLGLFCVAVSAKGPERPALNEKLDGAATIYQSNDGNADSGAFAGLLEPAAEGQSQTEPAFASSRAALDNPATPKLHHANSMDLLMVGSRDSRPQIRTEISYDDDKFVLTSDRQVKENKTLRAAGNVVITFRDMVITSDEAKYDEETRRAWTGGETKFSQNNTSLICSRAEFDLDTQTGTFYDASGSFYDTSGRQSFFSAGMVIKDANNKFQMYKDAVIHERLQQMKQPVEDENPPQNSGSDMEAAGLQRSVVPPAKVLFETGLAYMEEQQYIKARLAFQTLISTYPDSDFAASSYLKIADTFFDEGGTENLLKAEEQYKRFIALFPTHPGGADIGMKAISINMKTMRARDPDLKAMIRADEEIDMFLELYPDSDLIPVARQYREEVSRVLANHGLSKITGSVVDPDAEAITGVTISLIDKESGEVLQTTSPDGQGHFVIRGVPLKRTIGLEFSKNGLAPYFYDDPDPYSTPLTITMNPASIERIDIRGNRRVPEDIIRSYIQTEPGQVYSEIQLDSDIVAVYRSNYFDYVEIEQQDGDTGKIITFIVEEKLLIRSIEYSGNISFTGSDILDAFRKNKVGLTVDSQYEQRKIRAAERVLKDLMAQHGKPQGTIQIETKILSGYILLHFILDEEGGTPR